MSIFLPRFLPHSRGFKQRTYPTGRQEKILSQYFGARRFVYNWGLARCNAHYAETQKHLSFPALSRELTQLKADPKFKWLNEVPNSILQQSLRDLDTAFQRFFQLLKAEKKDSPKKPRKDGKPHNFPRFRKRGQNDRFRMQLDVRSFGEYGNRDFYYDLWIEPPDARHGEKFGRLKTRWDSRKPQQTPTPLDPEMTPSPKSFTLSRSPTGKHYISFMLKVDTVPLAKTKRAVGVDLGLKSLFVTSDNQHHGALKPFRESQRTLKLAQRKLKNKRKGSKRAAKQKLRVAQIHEKITNQRNDAIHKATSSLVKQYDLIAIEDLNVAGMKRNKKLSKSISDSAFSEFRRQLTYKCIAADKELSVIGRFFPSSKMCCRCGTLHEMPLKQRVMDCACGNKMDRDLNAAINIRNEGLRLFAHYRGHPFH